MIGKLDKRLGLVKLSRVPNGRGGFTVTEENKGEVWGAIVPMNSTTVARWRQLDVQANVTIYIRELEDLDHDWIITYKGKRYVINDIVRNEEFYEITAVG